MDVELVPAVHGRDARHDGFLLRDSIQGAFAPLLLGLGAARRRRRRDAAGGPGRRAARGRRALFANPLALWVSTSTFVEPALVLMVALAAWNLVRAARGAGWEAFALAGLFAGGAAGIKYLGLVAALLLAAAALPFLRGRLTPGARSRSRCPRSPSRCRGTRGTRS